VGNEAEGGGQVPCNEATLSSLSRSSTPYRLPQGFFNSLPSCFTLPARSILNRMIQGFHAAQGYTAPASMGRTIDSGVQSEHGAVRFAD